MNNYNLHNLFSVPLMKFDYGEISNDENKIFDHYLNDLVPSSSYNRFLSKENYILDNNDLPKLKKFIESAINDYRFFNTINLQSCVKKFNNFNSNKWRVPVSTGNLFLFPSNLPHEVDAVGGEENRISLSFNAFPFGVLGSKSDLTELRILQDK